jgi:hypothetical protein
MLEHKLEIDSQGHQPRYENKGGREIAIIARRTVSLLDSTWIREINKILNKTIVPEKNKTKSTKTKVSLGLAKKGTVKGLGRQIVEMALGSGEEGANAELIRHHRKTSRKFAQLPRVSEEEDSQARLV